ncbi:VanZ family protein [Actinoplanes sp. TFC3]|uniref:VanZ family protein n=1 Tax=Actinoplanes sp. TFC3 TaxID=1710355 RepID=UPI0008367E68|nr:VanZ family protein [Actinoplanes sp. TFC3]
MQAVWREHGTTVLLAALLLPVLAVAVCRWRANRRVIAEVGLVAGSLPWAVMLFTPQPAPRSIDLVPLHDLPSWISGDLGTGVAQMGGNLLVLAAFGFFLPMRFAAAASVPRVLLFALLTSTGIEVLQWVLAIGRVSSVDDVLINTLGAGAAAMLSRRWWVRIPEREMTERTLR